MRREQPVSEPSGLLLAGSGPPLVLFHSLIADPSSFGKIVPRLTPHFSVALATLPGFGETEGPEVEGLAEIADLMADRIRALSGARGVNLLGNGYGVFVALQLAIRHPELVACLVLTDAGACFPELGREAFRNMAHMVDAQGMEAVAETAMRRLFSPDFMMANPELVSECRRRFLLVPAKTFVAACLALAELDLRPHLSRIATPVLAVVGEKDEATPLVMSQELVAAIPGAELAVLPGCAHVPQLQAPDQFLATVLPFLKRRNPPRRLDL